MRPLFFITASTGKPTFFVTKKGRPNGNLPLEKALPQGRQGRTSRKLQNNLKNPIDNPSLSC